MSKKKALRVSEEVAPNLIPMIDIMFLLLLFFMLGADMGQRDLEDVSLPLASQIKEDKEDKDAAKDRLTINVYHGGAREVSCSAHASGRPCREDKHWKISVRKQDFAKAAELQTLLEEEAALHRQEGPSKKASERRVMIRADGSAMYGWIQDVMGECMKVGIYKIECGAARPAST